MLHDVRNVIVPLVISQEWARRLEGFRCCEQGIASIQYRPGFHEHVPVTTHHQREILGEGNSTYWAKSILEP
jgi:hypothetical protein